MQQNQRGFFAEHEGIRKPKKFIDYFLNLIMFICLHSVGKNLNNHTWSS